AERRLDNEVERLKKEAEANGGKVLSIDERLTSRMNAIAEQIQVLKAQEIELGRYADDSMRRSKEHQDDIMDARLLNEEIEAVKLLLQGYSEKLKELDMLPKI